MQIKHLSKNPMPHRSLTDSRSTNLGLLAVSLLLVLLVSGCSTLRFPGVYRIDVGQGNILTQEMVDKLRIGMTPRQVEFVMGSPMIADGPNQLRGREIALYLDDERIECDSCELVVRGDAVAPAAADP